MTKSLEEDRAALKLFRGGTLAPLTMKLSSILMQYSSGRWAWLLSGLNAHILAYLQPVRLSR
jgi:hypothetical protein